MQKQVNYLIPNPIWKKATLNMTQTELHKIELITILFEHCCIKVNYKYNMLEMSDKYELETFEAVTDTWILGEHSYSSE